MVSAVAAFFDALGAWLKSWRSAKAGAELEAGKKAGEETDAAADIIVAELKKKPKK